MNKFMSLGVALTLGVSLLGSCPAYARNTSHKPVQKTEITRVEHGNFQTPVDDEQSGVESASTAVTLVSDGYEWEDREGWGDFCVQLLPHWRCGRGR